MHSPRPLMPRLAGLLLLAGLAAFGRKPDYPSCETDKDCHDKEFCVARKCQQCRDSADCPVGSSCNAGKCVAITGYCRSKSDCPAATRGASWISSPTPWPVECVKY